MALSKNFTSDNGAGVSPQIIEALQQANRDLAAPYGNDELSLELQQCVSEVFEKEVSIFITSTGSAANGLALASLVQPWQGVMCHHDSHINNDECGAPEFYSNGAKLIPLSGEYSKINTDVMLPVVSHKSGDVHTVQPKAVSITQPTETGSLYSLAEVRELGELCKKHDLGFHMDGARFANAIEALNCSPAEITWKAGIDILSLGTTKNGTMSAELIVVFNQDLAEQLAYRHKRAGQLSSKMRFQSAQVLAYFDQQLWLTNARNANQCAQQLVEQLQVIEGIEVLGKAQSNIVFCRMPEPIIGYLKQQGFEFYSDRWGENVVRFVTNFNTTSSEIQALADAIKMSQQ